MTSIASNEKFKLPKNIIIFRFFIIILILLILLIDNFYRNLLNLNINNINQFNNNYNFTLNKFFNYPNLQIIICLIIYLLITLIATVKIVGKNYGTLRQK